MDPDHLEMMFYESVFTIVRINEMNAYSVVVCSNPIELFVPVAWQFW